MINNYIVVLAILIVGVNSRYLLVEDYRSPHRITEDSRSVQVYDIADVSDNSDLPYEHSRRIRRQAQSTVSTNADGSINYAVKVPLNDNDENVLSALGSFSSTATGNFKAGGGGLAWDSDRGHGASLTGQHISGFGDQLTGTAKLNLFHNDKHDVTASAFATKNFPSQSDIPSFSTYGGNLGYLYDNKVGATLGMAHTDLFKKTDYSAMGNLNLFKDRTSSFDVNAGLTKSVSPFISNSGWEPSIGLSYTKWF